MCGLSSGRRMGSKVDEILVASLTDVLSPWLTLFPLNVMNRSISDLKHRIPHWTTISISGAFADLNSLTLYKKSSILNATKLSTHIW